MKTPMIVALVMLAGALGFALVGCGTDERADSVSLTAFEAEEKTQSSRDNDALRGTADDLEDSLIESSYLRNRANPNTYGPLTVVLDDLEEDIGRGFKVYGTGNTNALGRALADARRRVKQLEDYHTARAVRAGYDSSRAARYASYMVWIDYQTLNPALIKGWRQTDEQYAKLMQGITGDKRRIVDEGIAAWRFGAFALFGRTGPLTQEEARRR